MSTVTNHWTPCDRELPPEGAVVETITASGMQSDLKRSGRLWFLPDGSMYVYYQPAMWRAKP